MSLIHLLFTILKGGKGSGNWHHSGLSGMWGGSSPTGGGKGPSYSKDSAKK